MQRILILLLTILVVGCVAVWGGSYNIAFSNSQMIAIEYDPAFVNVPEMFQAAQNECDKYGKDAIFHESTEGNLGIIVNVYNCIDRKTN